MYGPSAEWNEKMIQSHHVHPNAPIDLLWRPQWYPANAQRKHHEVPVHLLQQA